MHAGTESVFVVWETELRPGAEEEGLALTRRIWAEMGELEGYLGHRLLRDLDAPGRLLVVSRWTSRDVADRLAVAYKDTELPRRIAPLLARPRGRWVFAGDESEAGLPIP